MRTLVISDLHLGNRGRRDVVRRVEPRRHLLDVLQDIDRLVLLGDIAELATRAAGRTLAVAEPVLRAIGQQMGTQKQIILVPGNHDGPLVRSWARAQGAGLTLAGAVPRDASPALDRVASWLGPSEVEVRYPGVWLDERTYATHGHYLDRHLVPEAPVGLPRSGQTALRATAASPADYERRRTRRRERDRPSVALTRRITQRVVPAIPTLLMRARLAPVTASVVDLQMRHAALPALGTVLTRLDLAPEFVIFGHVHRRGPLADDQPGDWVSPGGSRLLNCGSWLYDRLLIDRAQPPHPYWPGGAVLLESGREPQTVGLLDDLDLDQLGPGPGQPRR